MQWNELEFNMITPGSKSCRLWILSIYGQKDPASWYPDWCFEPQCRTYKTFRNTLVILTHSEKWFFIE